MQAKKNVTSNPAEIKPCSRISALEKEIKILKNEIKALKEPRPFPTFDPAILAKCKHTHPYNRPEYYADHKYEDIATATMDYQDEVGELTGNLQLDQYPPEISELYWGLIRLEDFARAYPDIMKGFVMMEREVARCQLELAKAQLSTVCER